MNLSPRLAGLAVVCLCASAQADPLNPLAFASLGSLGPNDVYFIQTSFNGSTPLLFDQTTGSVVSGVISNGVAVFDFDSVNAQLSIAQTSGLAVAILSRGDLTILGDLNVTAGGFSSGTAAGSGAGGGTPGGLGGPGFVGPGRPSTPGGDGGAGAGDQARFLGGGVNAPTIFDGSQGGGAVELGAIGRVTVGSIDARGLMGEPAMGQGFFGGTGGGGGGGVLIHGSGVTIDGTINVSGGNGGMAGVAAGGGGGGGGYIAIRYDNGDFQDSGGYVVAGGLGGGGGIGGAHGFAGGDGTISIVPEPSGMLLVSLGGLCLVASMVKGRRPPSKPDSSRSARHSAGRS